MEILGMHMPTIEKVFPIVLIKFFFLYTSNYVDFLVLLLQVGETSKVTVWEQQICKNIFTMKNFVTFLVTVKNWFQLPQQRFLFVTTQNILIFVFSLVLVLDRSKVAAQIKKYFLQWECRSHLCILSKSVLNCICKAFRSLGFQILRCGRDQRSQRENNIFSKTTFCNGNIVYVSA